MGRSSGHVLSEHEFGTSFSRQTQHQVQQDARQWRKGSSVNSEAVSQIDPNMREGDELNDREVASEGVQRPSRQNKVQAKETEREDSAAQ